MLGLHSTTADRWFLQAQEHLEELLLDHAHCEKKAAGTAMNLIFAYVDRVPAVRRLMTIVEEELLHFRMVLDLLEARDIPFRRIRPSSYGARLSLLIRKQEPHRAVDRMLTAGLIEARSCERFGLLRELPADRELADFYGGLFESEARHHSTYLQLAREFADEETVRKRWEELADEEARIIEAGDSSPRMHS